MKRLKNLLTTALDEMAPSRLTENALRQLTSGKFEKNGNSDDICLVATGKAATEMTTAAVNTFGNRLTKGIVITSYETKEDWPHIEILNGSHPVPDDASVYASQKLVDFVKRIPPNSWVIYLISGGTSALFELPSEGIGIEELSDAYKLLNNSGASIQEINTVRKHMSSVKGGQLLHYVEPSVKLMDFIISDVPGDDPATIGSGPTTPDISSFRDACHILLQYTLWDKVSPSIRRHIEKGMDGIVPELIRPGEDPVADHKQQIIGSAAMLADKVRERAEENGMDVRLSGDAYNEDAETVASQIAGKAKLISDKIQSQNRSNSVLLIFYGESRVEVTGEGKGGRNQELALHAALEIQGYPNITWLSAGTDGIDGPTDAAGAIVDGVTVKKARELGLDPQEFLGRNDSYHFHEQMGTLLKTGPTRNNVMDLQLVLIE